nr:ARID DNA-binding domain-containing protein [Tanacetum cinerariifolium]
MHLCSKLNLFCNIKESFAVSKLDDQMKFLFTYGIGEVVVKNSDQGNLIPGVHYAPEVTLNILSIDLLESQGIEIIYEDNTCRLIYKFSNLKDNKLNKDKLRNMQNEYLEKYFESLKKGDTSNEGMKPVGMLSMEDDLIKIKRTINSTRVNTFNEYVGFLNLLKQDEIISQEWDVFRNKFDKVVKWFYKKYLEGSLPGLIPPKINGVTVHLMDLYKLVKSLGGYLSVYFARDFGKIGEILGLSIQDGEEGSIDIEELKGINSPPYVLEHVELEVLLICLSSISPPLLVLDAVLWCCRPQYLTLYLSIYADKCHAVELSKKQDNGVRGSRVFMVRWTKKYICDDRSTKGEQFISVLEESGDVSHKDKFSIMGKLDKNPLKLFNGEPWTRDKDNSFRDLNFRTLTIKEEGSPRSAIVNELNAEVDKSMLGKRNIGIVVKQNKITASRMANALEAAKLHDGYVAYPWQKKMQELRPVPNPSCFLSIIFLPKASEKIAYRYNDLEDTLSRANAWHAASQASGVPIVFLNIQTESLLAYLQQKTQIHPPVALLSLPPPQTQTACAATSNQVVPLGINPQDDDMLDIRLDKDTAGEDSFRFYNYSLPNNWVSLIDFIRARCI